MRSDAGLGLMALVIAAGSVLAGGAAATGAVIAVINTYGPNDQGAIQNGPQNVVPPEQVLSYGG